MRHCSSRRSSSMLPCLRRRKYRCGKRPGAPAGRRRPSAAGSGPVGSPRPNAGIPTTLTSRTWRESRSRWEPAPWARRPWTTSGRGWLRSISGRPGGSGRPSTRPLATWWSRIAVPVVDASVVVDLIAPDVGPDSPARALFVGWARSGAELLAPGLLWLETANALLTGIRRGRWSGADADSAAVLLRRLPVRRVAEDHAHAFELARRYENWP